MRLISFVFSLPLLLATPALAQDRDPALHCAALTVLSGQILAEAGEASEDDLATLREISNLMLVHVKLPVNQRADALRAYAAQYRKQQHSDAEIATEVDKTGDACLRDFVNS